MTCLRIDCPDFGFRCAYGACLNADVECNGVQDCADNSDEETLNCPGVIDDLKNPGKCKNLQFECQSGECISIDLLCDGKNDCQDGSDEHADKCKDSFCPSYGFRCAYGACISEYRKCNGVIDCVDMSDESPELCGTTVRPQPPPTTKPPDRSPAFRGFCTVNYIPANGRASPSDNHNVALLFGNRIESLKTIVYQCNSNYVLTGSRTNKCVQGNWISTDLPVCKVYCDVVKIKGFTITPSCEFDGHPIDCTGKLLPGTIARISCAYGYQKVPGVIQDSLVCLENGTWSGTPSRCIEDCGLLNSDESISSSVPWYAVIYSKNYTTGTYKNLCAGTILNAKMVVSAANCFWNASSDSFVRESNFLVGVGKIYKGYSDTEPNIPQFLSISQIDTIEQFGSRAKFFYSDVAILILEGYITYTPFIKPICFDLSRTKLQVRLPDDITTQVAKLHSSIDNRRRTIETQTINQRVCETVVANSTREYLTSDKFCSTNSLNDEFLCKDDNGGGVFVEEQVGKHSRYFLRGVIFLSYLNLENCEHHNCLMSTNILIYSKFIARNIARNPL